MATETSGSARHLEEEDTELDPASASRPRYQQRSDLFHALRADHREMERLFTSLLACRPGEHRSQWEPLSIQLTAHTRAEREVVYARLMDAEGERPDTRHWLEVVEQIEALMTEIDGLPSGDAALPVRVQHLRELVQHHVLEEESKLIPRVEALLGEELDAVTVRFEQRKRRIYRQLSQRLRLDHALNRAQPQSHSLSRPLRVSVPRAGSSFFVEDSRSEGAFLHARILVVDDEEDNLRVLQRILASGRYSRVETTVDPHAVLDLYLRNPYDLILLDLEMPRLSGLEVMERLKRLDPESHPPVVALASEPAQQLQALRAGARDFLCKPFDVGEVLGRVGSVLAARMPEIARRQRYSGLERDLALAAQIYRALLPSSLPCCPGYDLGVISRSASETSGDVYDLFARPDGRLALLLADATGHGIGPALSVTQLRSMVRIGLRLGATLEGIVGEADRQLSVDLPPDRFVTAFMGELDPDAHTLEYHAPGQGPLLHWHCGPAWAEWRNASGPPLGLGAAPFERPLPMRLAVGDVVILATDGLYERTNRRGELFGKAGVEAVLRDAAGASAQTIGHLLQSRADRHAGGRPVDDDVTIIVLKRTG